MKALRLASGRPLRQIADESEKAGRRIDPATLCRLENGQLKIGFDHAEILAKVYRYPVPKLMEEMATWYQRQGRSSSPSSDSTPATAEKGAA